ncbi:hypothetical protein LOC68_07075 [Blastopirellula sp. JC732]|uniref:Uncharacterized protein n=1 Tax=Blastopirellula sediminis TaxID=2894196 RepID=A0A9X1SFU4_9BACT|nr:hypothetical protein [Blastopirellula sediminis]MCC9609071.1 hypothetical protein [Blastopirellula sediminis]MCC9628152.1 hypothetical protein [Blastopirellula sediminis]
MDLVPTTDATFLTTVARWIDADGEVFIVVRYPNQGGATSYEHFTTPTSFTDRLRDLRPATSVVILRGFHLPLRGVVDDVFISQAIEQIPDGTEWVVVGQTPVQYGTASWLPDTNGDTHVELEEALRDPGYFGKPVIAGLLPSWWESDCDTIISAFVPNEDGSIEPAAY